MKRLFLTIGVKNGFRKWLLRMICKRWFLNGYWQWIVGNTVSKNCRNHSFQTFFSKTHKQSHSMLFFARIFRSFRSTSKKFLLKHSFQNSFSTIIFRTTCFKHHLSNSFFKQSLFKSLQKSFEPSFQTTSSKSSLESIYEIIWSIQNIHSSKTLSIILWDHWLFHF